MGSKLASSIIQAGAKAICCLDRHLRPLGADARYRRYQFDRAKISWRHGACV